MIRNRRFIVFGIEHYNTLGLIRTLGSAGIQPVYIGIHGKASVASKSKYVSDCYFVKDQDDGLRLLLDKFGDDYQTQGKPFLFCIDDKTISYLDNHYEQLEKRFVFFNAGKAGRINQYMDKFQILKIAEKHHLDILPTYCCKKNEIPENLVYPIITKSISPVVGGWKADVNICYSEYELKEAYQSIKADTVILQQYIEKENEYCLEGFSINHGRQIFTPIEITYNYKLPNYYSPYMTVRNTTRLDLVSKIQNVLEEIGFEGLFEAEFLIAKDGTVYFSEINFRNSPWSYSATVAQMPMAYLWAESMIKMSISDDYYKPIEEPFTAMVEPIDYQKRVVERGMDKGDWFRDVLNCRCLYYYDSDDIEPFVEMIRHNEKLR